MPVRDRRKAGDTTAFSVRVDFGETVNLLGTSPTFTLATLDFTDKPVDGAVAEAVDITSEVAGTGGDAPLLSVWELSYEPAEEEVVAGDYVGYFRVQFAGGNARYFPGENDYMLVEVSTS